MKEKQREREREKKNCARIKEREGGRERGREGEREGERGREPHGMGDTQAQEQQDAGTSSGARDDVPVVLLTAFSAWGLLSKNPSQVIAQHVMLKVQQDMDGMLGRRAKLEMVVLPVDWEVAPRRLREEINRLNPVAVLSLGLSQGISNLHVERVAINLCNGKDIAGTAKMDVSVVEGGYADPSIATGFHEHRRRRLWRDSESTHPAAPSRPVTTNGMHHHHDLAPPCVFPSATHV